MLSGISQLAYFCIVRREEPVSSGDDARLTADVSRRATFHF
jgi:hypothetical protein